MFLKKVYTVKSEAHVSSIFIILKKLKQRLYFLFKQPPAPTYNVVMSCIVGRAVSTLPVWLSRQLTSLPSATSLGLSGHRKAELMCRWQCHRGPGRRHPPDLAPRHGGQGKGQAVIKGQLEAREPAAKGGGKGNRIPGM